MTPANTPTEPVIQLQNVCTHFGNKMVHQGLNLEVRKGEIFAIVGGSGSGKSTLLREMILLHRPDSGSLRILGVNLPQATSEQILGLRKRWGVMFQYGGLFAALTVLENVGLPMREHRHLSGVEVDALAAEKIALSGLKPEVGAQYPSSLSGGMLKRASLARALALEPELLFLDEPTAGLDPQSADGVDDLILALRKQQNISIVMVTHDLDLLWHVADRVAVLADGKVQGLGSMPELSTQKLPAVHRFFTGTRGGNAFAQHQPTGQAWKPK